MSSNNSPPRASVPHRRQRSLSGESHAPSVQLRLARRSIPPPPPPPAQISALRPASSRSSPARPRLTSTQTEDLVRVQRHLSERSRIRPRRPTGRGSALAMSQMQLEQADRRLSRAISDSRAILQQPVSTALPQGVAMAATPVLESPDRRPAKRRRIGDPEKKEEEPKIHPVSYGYRGQVVPGKLDMIVKFCDGGIYEGHQHCCTMHGNYGPENILNTDGSVYCTKGSRANIILAHKGERPFTMQELIIKAPRSGYTSPVREGMLFVGMDADELMTRTAKYKIKYEEKQRRRRVRRATSLAARSHMVSLSVNTVPTRTAVIPKEFIGEDEGYKINATCTSSGETDDEDNESMLSTRNPYLDDPDEPSRSRSSIRARDRASQMRFRERLRRYQDINGVAESDSDSAQEEVYDEADDVEDEDEEEENADSQNEDSNVSITSESESDSESDDDDTLPDYSEHNDAPTSVPPRTEPADETEADPDPERWNHTSILHDIIRDLDKDYGDPIRERQDTPHPDAQVTEDGSPRMLKALARFSIERGKSTCKMVFEPAISARYVLLKLWRHDGVREDDRGEKNNIDIQSVVVKGFCGPRSFPAMKLR